VILTIFSEKIGSKNNNDDKGLAADLHRDYAAGLAAAAKKGFLCLFS